MTEPAEAAPLLAVSDLKIQFGKGRSLVRAVDGVSFAVRRGETLGIVGESGSGKSVTARSILRLVQTPPGRYAGGEILFEGEDLLKKSEAGMRAIRGNRISMIFQEPMTSLTPVLTVGYQIAESLRLHQKLSAAEARKTAVALLQRVRIADAERRVDEYPHQLSGGMRQRAMIAMALACRPKLLIADEPTTALDVTIQAQVLALLAELRSELGMSIILITHNFGIVAEVADRVAVMYAGVVVETAPTAEILRDPRHPYTKGLLGCIPRLEGNKRRLNAIKGSIPSPGSLPTGCRFHPRCPSAMPICAAQDPPEVEVTPGHIAKCWLESPPAAEAAS